MNEYEIGKDIESLKNRVATLEAIIHTLTRKKCRCSDEKVELVATTSVEATERRSKTGSIGRRDHAECECQEQSITIKDDGSYEYTSLHYNHSRYPDDGDNHRMTIVIYAGDEIVHTFEAERFVPNYKQRTLRSSGQSNRLRDRFDALNRWNGIIVCD